MDEGIDSCSLSVKRKIRNLKFLRIWSSFDETMSSARERNSSYAEAVYWTMNLNDRIGSIFNLVRRRKMIEKMERANHG
jgi:hypothetical protein